VQALLRVTRSMGEATLVRHLLPALLGVLTPPSPPPPASHNFNAAAAPAGEHNGPLSPKLPDWTGLDTPPPKSRVRQADRAL
jgi:hypothetical protein